MTTEQDEINANYARIASLEDCALCQKTTESGISFCNAICENNFERTNKSATVTTCLFEKLDKSEVDLLVARNANKMGWVKETLANTSFECYYPTFKIKEFLATIKYMVVEELACGAVFKCYFSQGFAEIKMNIKVYVGQITSMIEVRKLSGCSELFHNVYRDFENFMLGTNKVTHSMKPSHIEIELSPREEEEAMNSLLQWMKQRPEDGIKTTTNIAMEKNKYIQHIMIHEVFETIHSYKMMHTIAPQILGFIDTMKTNPHFKLGNEYLNVTIALIKQILNECINEIKNPSVKLRIQEL